MYLRKWSPIKFLMYLWLAILVWIFCWCDSSATMHLAPSASALSYSSALSPSMAMSSYAESGISSVGSSRRSSSSSSSSGSSSNSYYSRSSGSSSRNSLAELSVQRDHHSRVTAADTQSDTRILADSTSPYQWRPSSWQTASELTTSNSLTTQKHKQQGTSPLRDMTNVGQDRRWSTVHHPAQYASRMTSDNSYREPSSVMHLKSSHLLPVSLSHVSASNTSSSDSSSIISTSSSSSTTSEDPQSAIDAEARLQHQWKLRMSQKRARRLAHRRHLSATASTISDAEATNRNRRDSARLPSTPASNLRRPGAFRPGPSPSNAGAQFGQGRRYCSARDPATLAFDAPIVFEGKIKSMSSDRRSNFSVTFELMAVHKKNSSFFLPNIVRLQFTYRNYSECDIYREPYRERGIVREDLEQGKVYFLFVKQIDLGNFSILGQPIRKTRRTTNGVLEGVSKNYGKEPKITSLTPNMTRHEGKRVRLVCKVSGQPPPKVTWFKDKRSINRNVTKYAQVHLKKRSELIIHSVTATDAGEYECRAKNKKGKISTSTHLRVTMNHTTPKPTKSPPDEPYNNPRPCRVPGAEHFCLNGGTCIHFEDLQEWACTCPKGFSGNKCENKDIDFPPTSSSKHQDCSYGIYGGHPECADFLLMDSPVQNPAIPPLLYGDYGEESDSGPDL
ncbi:protein vein [Uranotaenia lowii]|uniref:protein vein n=1 Tax=Uranotaenia lowii TaxID=190385 RepID=UPI00247A89AF|nr:protein vein [Uranotaenia lowii]XP_055606171.1 protein vein [Uranotaenia lowii]XP_055606172.1 protein vein [Uranotaenia lowii]